MGNFSGKIKTGVLLFWLNDFLLNGVPYFTISDFC